MKISRAARTYLALGMLVGFVLLTNLVYWGGVVKNRWDPAKLGNDSVSDWESRFTDLKRSLPLDGVVGYVSEEDIGLPANPIDRNAEFALTQYALAPRIVLHGTRMPFVIGNFGGVELTGDEIARRLDLTLIRNYGWGIYLFRGKAQ